ncbi:unnamed protein product, partial [marine sediment metagenome]
MTSKDSFLFAPSVSSAPSGISCTAICINLPTIPDTEFISIYNREKTIYSWPAKEFSLGLFDISAIFPKVGLIAGYSSEEKLIQNLYPALENFAPMMGGALVDNQYEGINYKSLPNPMFPLEYGIVGDRFVLSSGIANIIDAQKGDMTTLDKLEAIKYMLSFPKVFS